MTEPTANGQNGQAGGEEPGFKPPDPSEVVEHLRAATVEIVAAGRALLDMMEQAMGGFLSAMTGKGEGEGKGGKPRVEKIDVEDERKKKEGDG